MSETNNNISDDDDEYEDSGRGFNLGFIFGNVDNCGDLDADYLDEDAKEHLSALADKLGSSMPDVNLLAKSERTLCGPAERDYDRKAEDAVDYENIDEEYDGPEVQEVSEEDHLLPKMEYFSGTAALGCLNSRASVFDNEDYDNEEEQEALVEEDFGFEERETAALKEGEAVECEKDEKSATSLPTLYLDNGMVILQFSEIFAVHEPRQKRYKRENRYIAYKEKYISIDISELVEEDDEVLLKSHCRTDSHVKQADQIQLDVPLPIREGLQLVKAGTVRGITPESRESTKLGRNAWIMSELLKEDFEDGNSSLCQSHLTMEVFPLDQQGWEHRILWENSPELSGDFGQGFKSKTESESMLVQGTHLETERESLNVLNSREQAQTDNNMLLPLITNPLESFSSRGSQSTNDSTIIRRHHPQLLRLDSSWDKDHLSENDDSGEENLKPLKIDALGSFSRVDLQERDMGDEAWLDSIIWDSHQEFSRPKLVFDLQPHDGSMIVSQSSKPNYGWQFNISNDKFYMDGKNSQQLKANANKSGIHSLRVYHSAPAVKLQTLKNKLSNKEIANFHRPKALWYPHDTELTIKQEGNLPTQRFMKIVVKSLGGKGSKIHVGIEESVSSIKAKASRKLDFEETEAVRIFYIGKELEDEKSLSEQNVQPNSLLYLLRTKIHMWPSAQKIPVENISLRPPGAFKKKSDLSTRDGHVFLMEYCEERPLMLSNPGMGANLCTYIQKSSPVDQHGNLDSLGNVIILEPGDKSPFLGEIHGGCSQSSIETNMYKAPVFPHRLQSTDYLLVRSPKGKLSLRRINKIFAVGQQEPRIEVMSPASKNLQTYLVNRMLVYVYGELKRHCDRIAADELSFLFSNLSDALVKKNMKVRGFDLERDNTGQFFWSRKNKRDKIPSENELKNLVTPEDVCSYESMLSGLYRLKHLGITRFTLPASISTALDQLPDEAITLAAASHIERELQITPWNLSGNFVACTNQERVNIERLEITGLGDPSGRGQGFSYVRAAAGRINKKVAACRGPPTVTGTDADLRKLSMEAAREVLLKFNVLEKVIAKQTRWHRIAMIRRLSSEQAASGVQVDPTTIGKYARGQRMSFLQLKQQAREKCQEIWDRQLLSLSVCDEDENESENEGSCDLDSFVGDLENLLDAEEDGDEEESNMSKNEKLDGVKGMKMRRWKSQVEADEEVEDEAADYAELCRLLMQDNDLKKIKKMKAVGEGTRSFEPLRPNVEPFRKALVVDKKPIPTQTDASFKVNESTVKDTTNVFKVRKSARENFACGACGQHGHMKTNKHCPKYRENTESHPEGINMKMFAGKPCSSDPSGQVKMKPVKNKKPAQKSTIDVSVYEAAKGDISTSKMFENYGLETPIVYDTYTGNKSTSRISKLKIVSMAKPEEFMVETGRHSRSLGPATSRDSEKSESHNTSVSIQTLPSKEKTQGASSRHPISVMQPSVSMERGQAESRRPHLVICPPTERRHPQKRLVIKRSIADHDRCGLEVSPPSNSGKTKRMTELADFQRQQRFRLSENSLDQGPKCWGREQEILTEKHREGRGRRYYDDMTVVSDEPSEIAEIRRYEEAIRSEREEEEEERQKAKNKKKLQPVLIERRYIQDHPPPQRNDRKRGLNFKSQHVSGFESNEAEYLPKSKRRKKGEVGLANILEGIVDTLRSKDVNVSYLFLKPVTKKEAPDYFDIVERPMDLSTIRDKVKKIEYRDRGEFRHDVWQIKFNAHLYNDGRNPAISCLADELLVRCDDLLDRYRDDLTEAEKGIVER